MIPADKHAAFLAELRLAQAVHGPGESRYTLPSGVVCVVRSGKVIRFDGAPR